MRRQTPNAGIGRNVRGRRARNRRLPSKRRRRNPSIALACLAAVLLFATGIVYWAIYHEGYTASKSAQDLLAQYNQTVSDRQGAEPSAVTANASGAPTAAPGGNSGQPEAADAGAAEGAISLSGYNVIGKLRIDKIGVELPVLSETTEKALKVSICYYGGAKPGEKGNMIIAGHNFANGAHFGQLHKLTKGDTVIFDTPAGKAYTYIVYEMKVVKPDDMEALNEYQGNCALTLATCASSGNRRLLAKCALK